MGMRGRRGVGTKEGRGRGGEGREMGKEEEKEEVERK